MGKAGRPNNEDIRTGNPGSRYYDPLTDTDPRKTEDRVQFLKAIRDKNPAVLASLGQDVYPVYESIWKQIESCQTPEGLRAVKAECERQWGPGVTFAREFNDISRWGMINGACAEYRSYPEVAQLGAKLIVWASRFHLLKTPRVDPGIGEQDHRAEDEVEIMGQPEYRMPNGAIPLRNDAAGSRRPPRDPVPAEWILNVALRTQYSWAEAGRVPSPLDWIYPVSGITPVVGDVPPPPFEFESWQPQMESRADYRNRYLVASTDRLDRYLEVIETMAQQSGLEPETLRRQPRGDRREAIPENREFEWLALWQTAGLRYGEIQEQYRFSTSSGYSALYDESSIRKAIRAAAQRVGIALRK